MLRGTVMLLLPDGKELLVEAVRGGPEAIVSTVRYGAGEGVIGRVAQTAQPAVIPRVSEEPRFQNRIHNRPTKDCDEVSFLCVPVRLDGEVIGTLSVDLPATPPELLAERVRVLEIVASMISCDVRSRQGEAMRRQSLEAENLRLRDALQEQFRPENILGNSRLDARGLREDQASRRQRHHGLDPRRIGHRQGTRGLRRPLHQSAGEDALRQGELRGAEREPPGERVVRPREGGLHRGPVRADRTPGGSRGRHAVPRRNRRFLAGHSGQAAAGIAGARIRARGQQPHAEGQRADRGRHESGSGGPACRRPLPAGSLLPDQRLPHHAAAASRAEGRHPALGRPFRRRVCKENGQRSCGESARPRST